MSDALLFHPRRRPWRLAVAVAVCAHLVACDHDRSHPGSEPARPAASATQPAPAPAPSVSASAAKASPEGAETAEQTELVPAGSPIIPLRPIELAVYLKSPAPPALVADAEQKVRSRFPGIHVLTKPEPGPPPSVVVFSPDLESLELPSAAEFALYGRDLAPPQLEAAASSKGALLFGWLLDGDPKLAELRKAQDLLLEVAQKNGGFVWDDASHELFSPQSWKALRIDGWQGDIPDTRRHFTTRYYRAEGRSRAVTLGLAKLGLPDLVVQDVPIMQSAAVVTLFQAIAQTLVEGGAVGAAGHLVVDGKTIHHTGARAALVAAAAPNATLHGTVTLAAVDPEEGDAENRLAEVRFDAYPGANDAERQLAAIHAILGAVPDQMAGREAADPEHKAIAQRAQAHLPALAAALKTGLPAGSELYVKIPFAGEGELFGYRWISVVELKGGTVRGVLRNEPVEGQAVDVGEPVLVSQSWVADYLLRKADGTQEGGESLKGLRGAPGKK